MWFGWFLTSLYLVGIGFYSFAKWSILKGLPPNEIGDFLAGSFAPLVLSWVVIAVVLQKQELNAQRVELRQNGEALRMQAGELRRSVEQMEKQAEHMSAALRQRENERYLEMIRELTRRLTTLMCVIAKESQEFSIAREGAPEGPARPIFGPAEMYLDYLGKSEYGLAAADFMAHVTELKEVLGQSDYRVNISYSGLYSVHSHLLVMRDTVRDIVKFSEQVRSEAETIYPIEQCITLRAELDAVLAKLDDLVT